MANKRYAIIRVDNGWCPLLESDELCDTAEDCFSCKIKTKYGDTKEQMIAKVLQVMRRNHLGWCNMKRISKEIVEFLGVVE